MSAKNKFTTAKKIHYKQARKNIKPGDFLFCSGNYFISNLIKRFSKSIFSHVAFVFKWNNRILVFESIEDDGIRIMPLSHYLYNYENTKKQYRGRIFIGRHKQRITSSEMRRMIHYAVNFLNRNYDRGEILKIAFRIVTGKTRHKDDDEYMCSEFVDICFKKISRKLNRGKKGFIYPEHIATDKNVRILYELIP